MEIPAPVMAKVRARGWSDELIARITESVARPDQVSNLASTAFLGGGFAVAVLFLFLRDFPRMLFCLSTHRSRRHQKTHEALYLQNHTRSRQTIGPWSHPVRSHAVPPVSRLPNPA